MGRQHRLEFLNHSSNALLTAGALCAALCAGPAAAQSAGPPYVLSIFAMTTVDDTAFVPRRASFALFTDVNANMVYRLDSPMFGFEPGTAYSTSDTAGIVAVLNLDNGNLTPIAMGFGSTRGMIFVSREDPGRTAQGDSHH